VILVDSNLWIDSFRNRPILQSEWLDRNLATEGIVVGDLILAEVLQGFRDDRGFDAFETHLGLRVVDCGA